MRQLDSPAVSAVVLASGFSTRFRSNKLLLPLGKETVIGMTIRHVQDAGISRIAVVIPKDDDSLYYALPEGVDKVYNAARGEGVASSIRAGIDHFRGSGVAVFIINGDQPVLPSSVIDRMINLYRKNTHAIVACAINGDPVNPAIFPCEYFEDLMHLQGDMGAKPIIVRNMQNVIRIEVNPELLADIDTYSDYEIIVKLLQK